MTAGLAELLAERDALDARINNIGRRRAAIAACGTDSGYYRHLRGTRHTPPDPPCDDCLAAHSLATRIRWTRNQAEAT